jgi:hypothetical protein
MILVIFPFKNWDAKMAVLIGDDAKRSMGPDFLPSWAPNLESLLTTISHEKLEKGNLAGMEFDWEAHELRWITFYQMIRDLAWALHRDLGFGSVSRSPHVRVTREGELGVGFTDMVEWDKRSTVGETILETPRADVVHLLATLITMLTIDSRVPYSSIGIEDVMKGQTSDTPPVRNEATLADIMAERVFEYITRLDQVLSLGPKSPPAGG